jgi:hypothetical protein
MISEEARAIAVNPFVELDLGVLFHRFDLPEACVFTSNWPMAALAVPASGAPDDLPAAVAGARTIARDEGKSAVGWWISPRHDELVPRLEQLGLTNTDTPGFEAVETAMALDHEPTGGRVDGVEVRSVETLDDFIAAEDVVEQAFGLPVMSEEENRRLFDDYSASRNTSREYVALVDGRPVGAGFAVAGRAAVNLFGGAVLEDARGRGVYRALTMARWDDAVERGAPVLTVQAGRQSRPILERLGFEPLEQARMFVDTLA